MGFGTMADGTGTCSGVIQDIEEFYNVFKSAKFVVAVTGAGISAESGIPTFRGPGGFWRGHTVQALAEMSKFKENPSLVWELYHYRREITLTKQPNAGHFCLAKAEEQFEKEGRKFVIITQNIDELHTKAGSKNVVELHGTLFKTECLECGTIAENYDSPICPALKGKGIGEEGTEDANIPVKDLPKCNKSGCGGLLRPYIIWYDEDPTDENLRQSYEWLDKCDLCLVIGTSSVVEPADGFGPLVASRGVPVAEFNLEKTCATNSFKYHIQGPCGTTLPEAMKIL